MPDDGHEALDAYSAVVTAVADAVLPSVASLAVRSRRGDGAGSASVLTPDGYLLTSAHVVVGARSAEATFTDGSTVAADVAGRDELSDLAVLQARGDVPPPVDLGERKACASGSWWSRWATRSGWRAASPPASSPRSADRCPLATAASSTR